jgi:SynChlorMet cassette radical SAM/SPASM protein ScmF
MPEQGGRDFDLPEGIPPLRAFYLYLSSSCNLACRHCWISPSFINGQPDPGDVIDIAALRSAIAEAKQLGLASVKLTGGEPLLHPRFLDIASFVSRENLALGMETNGTLLTRDLARFLKDETTLEFVSVSIDGPNAACHDDFRGVPGAFDGALRGLDYLVAAGHEQVQVIMSVHRGNRSCMESVVRLAAEHGAVSVKFNPVSECGRGKDMERRGEVLDVEERLALYRYVHGELASRLHGEGIMIDLQIHMPPALLSISELLERKDGGDCGVLGILGILGNGNIALCGIGRQVPELVFGQLGEDSIRGIWLHHPTVLELRRILADIESYPGICGRCTMAKYCHTGCVAWNYLNRQKLVWPDPLCAAAEQRGLFPETRQKRRQSHRL